MFIPRAYNLEKEIEKSKILSIFGPRQVGKTTLVKHFLENSQLKYRFENGGNMDTQEWLSSLSLKRFKEELEGYELLVVDEAQKVPKIGEALKLIADELQIYTIVTGSSSFELAGQIGEPLVGRKKELELFPLSVFELCKIYNKAELKNMLEDFLIFGMYPEIFTSKSKQEKSQKLKDVASAYLFKDILEFERVKDAKVLRKLLALLAFQIGKEVSLTELSNSLDISVHTVARYLDLLEKSFVIYSVQGFSRNLRKEVTKTSRYFFYDNGIRNAVISNFNKLELRDDLGALWENFIFMERLKTRKYKRIFANVYFWRTWDQKEIDLVEERDGKLFAYEFKFNPKKEKNPPALWEQNYPNSEFQVINKDNFLDFVL